jgi:hypothetical protein
MARPLTFASVRRCSAQRRDQGFSSVAVRPGPLAAVGKALYTGSIPVAASNSFVLVTGGAQGFGLLGSQRDHPAPIPRPNPHCRMFATVHYRV